jgi:hypothetical protein
LESNESTIENCSHRINVMMRRRRPMVAARSPALFITASQRLSSGTNRERRRCTKDTIGSIYPVKRLCVQRQSENVELGTSWDLQRFEVHEHGVELDDAAGL